MHKALVLLALAGAVAVAGPREVTYLGFPGCPSGGCPVPVFDRGYLFDQAAAPRQSISAWDNEGQPIYRAELAMPDGTAARRLHGVAVDSDGTVAVPVGYGDGVAKGGAIILLDRSGKPVRTINTGRYTPNILTFAEDHSLWVAGMLFDDAHLNESKADYSIVRHYGHEGGALGEYLPRSSFPKGLSPAFAGINWMQAAHDRVGILTYPGMVGDTPTWVELDLNGKELGRWSLDPHQARQIRTCALTSDGRLFGTEWDKEAKRGRLLAFDRPTSTWQVTTVDVPGLLLGADGDYLVFWNSRAADASGERLVWVPAPKAQ